MPGLQSLLNGNSLVFSLSNEQVYVVLWLRMVISISSHRGH